MANALRPEELTDFRGGLNLRADAFTLLDTESPDMLNVDVDVRAGVRSRRSWSAAHSTALSGVGHVTRLHSWQRESGSQLLVAATDAGKVLSLSGSTAFAEVTVGGASLACSADVHGAEFVEWGDKLYVAGGRASVPYRWSGTGDAVALTRIGPTYQNDYTAPTSGFFPAAEHACTYSGYMVAANTRENGVSYPNRIRFSHPNNPENWRQLDFLDIEAGGSKITGLVAFDDHVLVLKDASLWAIYGYDAQSFAPVQIAGDTGCPHRNAVAVGVQSAYFWTSPNGVMEYLPGEGIRELSEQLRPAIDSGEWNTTNLSSLSFGWVNRRLWVGAPYEKGQSAPSVNKSVFVFEPLLGSWTKYVGANGDGLGAFATGADRAAAYSHAAATVLSLDDGYTGSDDFGAGPVPFETLYATRWVHLGLPDQKKSWRRPSYVVTEMEAPYTLTVDVMRNYEEANPRSTHIVEVDTGSDTVLWGVGTWGDGTLWGVAPAGAHVERGGSIGLADSVQLRIAGGLGQPWGINAIIMKYRSRRFR
jgi:hypothetical protein